MTELFAKIVVDALFALASGRINPIALVGVGAMVLCGVTALTLGMMTARRLSCQQRGLPRRSSVRWRS